MRDGAASGFENGAPVPTCGFDYDTVDGKQEAVDVATQDDALETLRSGLLVVIAGHRDAACVRAAALARLCNLFDSDAAAARAIRVSRSTVGRAIVRMRQELRHALRNAQKTSGAKEHKPLATPRQEIMQRTAHLCERD